ncbi:MAG TPA: hypothetical protein VGO47_04885 [Chlamydiales bacterium]|nr:hypothetical protein [Chlamydiales bacterium]
MFYELCGFFGLALGYHFLHHPPTPWSQAFAEARTSWFYHVVFLTVTVVLYRLSPFHPLASFPGPILARVTSFYMTYVVATGKRHTHFIALHNKYGTFVRTGNLFFLFFSPFLSVK